MKHFPKPSFQIGGWNSCPLPERYFHALCFEHRVLYKEPELATKSFFCKIGAHSSIVVSSSLPSIDRRFAQWREFAHFLFDHDETFSELEGKQPNTNQRLIADTFASCVLIPNHWFDEKPSHHLTGLPPSIIEARFKAAEIFAL